MKIFQCIKLYAKLRRVQNHCIRFDKIDGFIKIYDKFRYLVLFEYSYCDQICDQIEYLTSEKVVLQTVFIIILRE